MSPTIFRFATFAAIAALPPQAVAGSGQSLHTGAITRSHPAMGTEFTLTVYARPRDANAALLGPLLEEVFTEIDQIEDLITTWRPGSQVSYVNAQAAVAPVRVAPVVMDLFVASRKYFDLTSGAFDCTVGPLSRLYGLYEGAARMPPDDELTRALDRVGMDKVRIDRAASTIAYDREGVEVDFGGIGKGFAIDRAIEILRARGVTRALLHGGTSSVYAIGAPPETEGWTVRIRHPYNPGEALAEVRLRDESLSTSGCYDLKEVDGVQICNIFDPRTGRPRRGMLSATAIAPTATESDALSTAFLVMGVEETRAFQERCDRVRAVLAPESLHDDIEPIWIGDLKPPGNLGSEP